MSRITLQGDAPHYFSDRGIVLVRIFRHQRRRTFFDDRLVQQTGLAQLWPGAREHSLSRGYCAQLIEEPSPVSQRNIPANELYDEAGRDGQLAPDPFLLALLGRQRRGRGARSKIQLCARQELKPVPMCKRTVICPNFQARRSRGSGCPLTPATPPCVRGPAS